MPRKLEPVKFHTKCACFKLDEFERHVRHEMTVEYVSLQRQLALIETEAAGLRKYFEDVWLFAKRLRQLRAKVAYQKAWKKATASKK